MAEEEVGRMGRPMRARQGNVLGGCVAIFALLGVVIIFAGMCAGGSGSGAAPRAEHSDGDAYYMCREFVKDVLRAPRTAKFPGRTEQGVTVASTGGASYVVVAYVDAQNAFGAMLRHRYRCNIRWDGGNTWRLNEPIQLME